MTNSKLLAAVLAAEDGAAIDAAVLPALAAAVDLVSRVLAVGRGDRFQEQGCGGYESRRLTDTLRAAVARVEHLRDWRPDPAPAVEVPTRDGNPF